MKKTIRTTIFLLTILYQIDKTGTLQAESKAFATRRAARKSLKEIVDRELDKGMFANREREGLCDGELDDNIGRDGANIWDDGLLLTLDIEEQTLDVVPVVKPDIRYRKGRTATDCRRYYGYRLTLTKFIGREETMWHISSPDGRYVGEAATLGKARGLVISDLLKQPLK